MNFKELNELREIMQIVIDKDRPEEVLRSDDATNVVSLIDAEIARQSVTDQDVRDAIKVMLKEKNIADMNIRNYADLTAYENVVHAGQRASHNYTIAITALEQMANRDRGGWIPVSERLPENTFTVLFLTKYDGQRMGSFVGEDWMTICNIRFSGKAVTHWQPLPEPPRGGEGK